MNECHNATAHPIKYQRIPSFAELDTPICLYVTACLTPSIYAVSCFTTTFVGLEDHPVDSLLAEVQRYNLMIKASSVFYFTNPSGFWVVFIFPVLL